MKDWVQANLSDSADAETNPETLLRHEIDLLSIRERRVMDRIGQFAEAKGGQLLESVI